MKTSIFFVSAILALGAGLGACINLTGFMDKPSGDAQLLSAARACLDNQDYECARKYYNQLSGNMADIKQSELAYTLLDENGAGMDAFITAFGNGDLGAGLTGFAEALATNSDAGSVGQTKRMNIFSAYQMASIGGTALISDSNIRNLVEFVSSIALSAELLAECVGTDGTLQQTGDLVVSGPACISIGGANCDASSGNLATPASAAFTSGLDDANAYSEMNISAHTTEMLFYAMKAAYNALNNLGASGKFGTTSSTINLILAVGAPTTALKSQLFRQLLLEEGVGR